MTVFAYHAFSLSFLKYLIPLFLILVPFVLLRRVNFNFRIGDLLIGIAVSAGLVTPLWFLMTAGGRTFNPLPAAAMIFQILGVSFPEEVYFRGFLQEGLGNTRWALLTASLLFALMHMPRLIFYGDLMSMMTFFPSLVMGYLYMRTSNILPSTIFHAAANIVFLGFYDIL